MEQQQRMKRSEAIRRAVGRIPVPEPPADLTARVMERLHRAERRRRRIEGVLAGVCSAGVLAGLAATGRWLLTREAEGPDGSELLLFKPLPDEGTVPGIDWTWPHINLSLPQLDLSTLAPGNVGLWKLCGLLAAAGLALLIADLLIRRRIASLRK